MRPPIKNEDNRILNDGFRQDLPISFTGDAIHQISLSKHKLFDIKEWIWHTEVINGIQYCIITEQLQHPPVSYTESE
ncbi:hypothetical protein [Niabella hirudinis]|uniref:hypothetical protein n=1 Tax=Niabella hirudinis TaxID=1285929 RepID=UPI003EBDA123